MDFMKMLEGGAGGEGMDSMMETMMLQLVSKDILYEPMKELNDKVRISGRFRSAHMPHPFAVPRVAERQ